MRRGTVVLIAASGLAGLGVVDCGGTPPRPTGTGGALASGGTVGTGGRASGGGSTYLCPPPNEDCCYDGLPSCMGDSACLEFPSSQVECSPKLQCTPCQFGCAYGYCRPDPSTTGGNGGMGGMGGEGGLGGDGNP